MMQTIIQLLSGALGSIGFGLLFHLNRRYLPAAGVGGLLAWLAYLLAAPAVHGTFLANLVGGVCAALYAEFMALAWCLADLSRKLHALLTGHNPAK